ncbi:TetR/AcrR family transcriptional regulator [Vibrio splendidus]|uniref:TetR/AcrR family transcriptional regulator n=1 Tax=Vibrio TaxID=662 RepID=UPI0003069693|nr:MULTISPECIES: TetR/AcrR family transcriptional regulator [Vibrio]MBO7911096.1 TetR/AcrR family transcriptional regulator [Vibrio sp. G41H]MCF7489931.1 TetR/AcrR family transcriptional regulator [Vibrio sp. G-C-1]MDH5902381.1 TetR/AcrR family transcriptional regulator [Vibrio splendidus]MDH5912631.1 TetR/AcrR family transcriptional regulator [Vibrio splendidus]MDH5930013.1 TetR/AcrR family transcriptional regulator [Vibrio splendidus]
MARITQVQKLENQKHYDEIVLNLFLAEGHEALTYARIAQEIGISLTTLQGYYPSTRAIRSALHQHMLSIVIENLEFSSEEVFIQSWQNALDNDQFRFVIKLMFFHASQVKSPEQFNISSDGQFREIMFNSFGLDSVRILETVVGRSMFYLTNFNQH